jgi:molecular chaperone DnaK (HSP70)
VVSRELLETVCGDLLERALQPVYGVLRDAGVHPDDVDDVVMVGGSSRLVAVSCWR